MPKERRKAMGKKNFKDSPALSFIGIRDYAQEDAQERAQQVAQEDAQQVATTAQIRTQGRKGFKKPRINLAFDSEEFLARIRARASLEGKSITQWINEAAFRRLEESSDQ
jgi:predicted DNA binding CopG/RHH family protein